MMAIYPDKPIEINLAFMCPYCKEIHRSHEGCGSYGVGAIFMGGLRECVLPGKEVRGKC